MAGKGGGAWKVAYADFITAMMAFFLVMWITAQNKPVRKAIANYFNDPFAPKLLKSHDDDAQPRSGGRFKGAGGSGRRPGEAYTSDVIDPNNTDIIARQPSLVVLRQGSPTSIGAAVTFEDESTELGEQQQARLRELLPLLLGKPQKIEIRGHATRRPDAGDGPTMDAWQLSYARCMAARKFLEDNGVEPHRMRLSQSGAFEPITLRPDSVRSPLNSRVEVFLLSEYAEDLMGTREERNLRLGEPATDSKK
jgi:chemotaxis protein MotB